MSYFTDRLRMCLCFVLAGCAGVCLYLGVVQVFSPREASADGIYDREPDPGLCLDLRMKVEKTAADLTATAKTVADPVERVRALSKTLDGEAGTPSGAYYMLWKDTRLVHSPNFPDLVGKNFFNKKDIDGRAFAGEMAKNAKNGGGFTVFTPDSGQGPLLAYSMPLPDTGLHITAHVPAVFEAEKRHEPVGPLYGPGFCLSGFSFAGLAALCGIRRTEA